MSAPRVSVLMTTRDGAAWIRPSLDSIFGQTMADFELVVVDDGSVDETPSILAAIADPRLRVIRNDPARGIAGGRNIGIAACRAPYVAVLDHDDIAFPDRLRVQADYLDANPATVLVGTAVSILNDGVPTPSGQPAHVTPESLRKLLLLGNPLTWSSMMVRRAALEAVAEGGEILRAAFEPADDFDLYHRLMNIGDVARLDDILTQYRWHATNASHQAEARIAARAAKVLARAYQPLFGGQADEAAMLVIRHLSDRKPVPDAATLDRLLAIIARVGPDAALGWSLVRAAVRGGRPWMVVGRPKGSTVDTVVSFVVGVARMFFFAKKNQKTFASAVADSQT
jgi:glycosyltransferase involved in cell wall biosynthesis